MLLISKNISGQNQCQIVIFCYMSMILYYFMALISYRKRKNNFAPKPFVSVMRVCSVVIEGISGVGVIQAPCNFKKKKHNWKVPDLSVYEVVKGRQLFENGMQGRCHEWILKKINSNQTGSGPASFFRDGPSCVGFWFGGKVLPRRMIMETCTEEMSIMAGVTWCKK